MSYVVDASIAMKWIVPEDDTDQAVEFLDRHYAALHAPDLLLVEVGGSLVRAVNERKRSREDAMRSLDRLVRLGEFALILHQITPIMAATSVRMATDLGHPLKDCIYLALADELGVPLATSDIKFRDRVGDPARVLTLTEAVYMP